jgi:hypothetical protein
MKHRPEEAAVLPTAGRATNLLNDPALPSMDGGRPGAPFTEAALASNSLV